MKSSPTLQKLKGAYYTPIDVAEFVANWAIQNKNIHVLEPSCGDGALVQASAKRLLQLGATVKSTAKHIHAVEFDELEAAKASGCLAEFGIKRSDFAVHNGDFFSFCIDKLQTGKKYGAVVGNPPFIRYQSFGEEQRELAFKIMIDVGLSPSRLTNAWLPFLIGSSLLLEKGGRLGMVIPAELFQVNYAADTRKFLSDYFPKITIITFRKLLFEGVQQEVVLLLCEKEHGSAEGIRTIELSNAADLKQYLDNPLPNRELIALDHSTEKWTKYFLSASEVGLLRELRKRDDIGRLGDYADVNVGVVTGLNEFFVLNDTQVKDDQLQEHVERIVGRSANLEGLSFTSKDWTRLNSSGLPASLFYPKDLPVEKLPKSVARVIKRGEQQGVNEGYKCSIRKRWYIVPSVQVPDGFMLRQVHSFPKLVLNSSGATSTDTVHRVFFKQGVNKRAVVGAFMNSMTFAFSEITGRSYGGGVLTFEPSEAAMLPLPINGSKLLNLSKLDKLLRKGEVQEILDVNDKILLSDGLGLSNNEILALRQIWIKLRDRRNGRNST